MTTPTTSTAIAPAPIDVGGHAAATLYEAALATLDQLPEGGHEIAGRRGQLFAVDPEIRATRWAKQMEMIQFNKDLALAGSALAFFWVFQNGVDFTITNGLFS